MARVQVKREQMEKWTRLITPEARHKLERRKMASANCFATYAGDMKFEVKCYPKCHIVDLGKKSCTCRG